MAIKHVGQDPPRPQVGPRGKPRMEPASRAVFHQRGKDSAIGHGRSGSSPDRIGSRAQDDADHFVSAIDLTSVPRFWPHRRRARAAIEPSSPSPGPIGLSPSAGLEVLAPQSGHVGRHQHDFIGMQAGLPGGHAPARRAVLDDLGDVGDLLDVLVVVVGQVGAHHAAAVGTVAGLAIGEEHAVGIDHPIGVVFVLQDRRPCRS